MQTTAGPVASLGEGMMKIFQTRFLHIAAEVGSGHYKREDGVLLQEQRNPQLEEALLPAILTFPLTDESLPKAANLLQHAGTIYLQKEGFQIQDHTPCPNPRGRAVRPYPFPKARGSSETIPHAQIPGGGQ